MYIHQKNHSNNNIITTILIMLRIMIVVIVMIVILLNLPSSKTRKHKIKSLGLAVGRQGAAALPVCGGLLLAEAI